MPKSLLLRLCSSAMTLPMSSFYISGPDGRIQDSDLYMHLFVRSASTVLWSLVPLVPTSSELKPFYVKRPMTANDHPVKVSMVK